MNEEDREYLIETMTIELAKLYIKDNPEKSMREVLDEIYNSDTFLKLCDYNTHLMFQRPGYVYGYLKDEILQGHL